MYKTSLTLATVTFLCISVNLFSFNFLINMLYDLLPGPVRSAFKGEGLVSDEFYYGYGNCNFTSLGCLTSTINYRLGNASTINHNFSLPTYYLYGGYIAHVSTPIISIIYPGWQLETEVGYGGISYENVLKDKAQLTLQARSLYVTGSSGFNWRIYKSPKEERFSWMLNLGFGYKLSSILKEELYYNVQTGIIWVPKILSSSLEYFKTAKAGNILFYTNDPTKRIAKEETISLSINCILKQKYLFKIAYVYKNLYLLEYKLPQEETELNLCGIAVTFLVQ